MSSLYTIVKQRAANDLLKNLPKDAERQVKDYMAECDAYTSDLVKVLTELIEAIEAQKPIPPSQHVKSVLRKAKRLLVI